VEYLEMQMKAIWVNAQKEIVMIRRGKKEINEQRKAGEDFI
jgi:hypothetical protein